MPKILAPTDLSDASTPAARYAMVLAHGLGASVELLFSHAAGGPAASLIDVEAHAREGIAQDFAAFVRTIEAYVPAGLTVTQRTEDYDAAEAIEKITRLEGDEVLAVVMGAHAESGLERVFNASTTRKVLEAIKHPLFAVPTAFAGATVAPRHVLWAVDGEVQPDERSVALVQRLLRGDGSALTFFHAGDATLPASTHLANLAGTSTYEVATSPASADGSVAAQILATAKQLTADLIVVTHRERGFFDGLFGGSVTGEALGESRVPVLILNAEWGRASRES